MGIVYAIASLSFAGVNDMVFKKYGQKRRPVGLFFCFIGVIWFLFFFLLGAARHSLQMTLPTLVIGSIAGIFSIAANIALVEGMKKTGAAIGATIYRLNLVFVAVMAFMFLRESITTMKIIALVFSLAAISLFSVPEKGAGNKKIAYQFIILLVAASILRACMGISYKIASNYAVSNELFLAVGGIWWAAAGILYYTLRERAMSCDRSIIRYSLISGVLICGIVFFLKLAVNTADASVAVTISQFSFLITAPLVVLFLKEHFSVMKAAGMAAAVICIILFSLPR
ncbi:MAG: DMT family transporter [Spirochaetes bacterium]|nr:DMT family transporter [Spirochaetota bacterium]